MKQTVYNSGKRIFGLYNLKNFWEIELGLCNPKGIFGILQDA